VEEDAAATRGPVHERVIVGRSLAGPVVPPDYRRLAALVRHRADHHRGHPAMSGGERDGVGRLELGPARRARGLPALGRALLGHGRRSRRGAGDRGPHPEMAEPDAEVRRVAAVGGGPEGDGRVAIHPHLGAVLSGGEGREASVEPRVLWRLEDPAGAEGLDDVAPVVPVADADLGRGHRLVELPLAGVVRESGDQLQELFEAPEVVAGGRGRRGRPDEVLTE